MTPVTHHLRIPAPAAPPRTGHLPFSDAPGAPDPVEITSRWLTRGGKPWFPVSGEFHYSRYPKGGWEEELLKMKAAGVTAVASYVIWIHHQETPDAPRFDGDLDLRRFAELCARHGLDFIPRIGPWSHAEVRNGGLPDWVFARVDAARTDDPAYLALVQPWFEAIAAQLAGLDRASGGPIIAIQIENELYDQPGHLLTLKRMAQQAGMDAPLWTSTAWGGVQLPGDELMPLYGGYPETFWTEADGGWPDTCRKHFFFTHQRDDEGIGADLRPTTVRGVDSAVYAERFPWATCELGGGMAVAYHRRPRVTAADIGSLGLTKIGCGSVWQGYYMFHGGTNPAPGLQESHATGYPNDLPVLTYDFQAPLGEYGQYRDSYDELRLQHLLLAEFGERIAPMESVLPLELPTGQHDGETLRWAVRTDGESGFLFVNNHQPHGELAEHPGTTFVVGGLSFPSEPFTVPQGAYFCWPFRMEFGGLRVEWATAQPVCTVQDGDRTVLVLAATEGVPVEVALGAGVEVNAVPEGAETGPAFEDGSGVLVTGIRPGTAARIGTGMGTDLLVLDAATARTAYKGYAWGTERLVLSTEGVVFDTHRDEVRLHGRTPGSRESVSFAVLPAPERMPKGEGTTEARDGVFTRYTLSGSADPAPVPAVELLRPAGDPPPATTGVLQRASAPADEWYERSAAVHEVRVPPHDHAGVLRLHWRGDVARAYAGGRLVADQFYSGRPWDIGLDLLPEGEPLTVRVLPADPTAQVYLPVEREGAAEVRDAEVVTARVWRVG
ncbi:beta-galactosidase [Streptomyces sp. NPDC004539]|uniref:beta-galactosidase n=1 Tax=Streptomyces sp. NPDC004539 TaxID=3154280 RepID=UPI0033AF1406